MNKKSKRKPTIKTTAAKIAGVDRILDTLPLIAPIPTAWAIGAALQTNLHWPIPVVGIAAAGIEAAGFVSADTASKYYEFNRTSEDGETKAPAWMAYGSLFLYVAGTLVMTFLYEPMAAVFPVLSAVAFVEFVLRKDHQARTSQRVADRAAALAKIEQNKAERKAARAEAKAAKLATKPAVSEPQPALAEVKPAFVCSCGKQFATQPALNAHKRAHKQIIGYTVSMEPVTKEQAAK